MVDSGSGGGGSLPCVGGQARLIVNGVEHEFDAGWGTNLAVPPDWTFAARFFSGPAGQNHRPFGVITGSTPSLGRPRALHDAFEPGSFEIATSLWALDATGAGVGEVLCTAMGSGSTLTVGLEDVTLDVRGLSSLGTCPGEPVDGELRVCHRAPNECTSSTVSGSLAGMPWAPTVAGVKISDFGDLTFGDGSILKFDTNPRAITDLTSTLSWGVLITSRSRPYGGAVFCVGSGVEDTGGWTFGQFSRLGACASDGAGSLSGCVH